MRTLAVDPGEKNLGIALSDPTGTIANPLTVLRHTSRLLDAAAIVQLAEENQAGQIIVGQVHDEYGEETPRTRHADRLAEAIRSQTNLPVILWDESNSTQAARAARIAMGVPRRKRRGHLDDLAATYILQTYLDHLANARPPSE
jgi:putative Holliday junction resolvase